MSRRARKRRVAGVKNYILLNLTALFLFFASSAFAQVENPTVGKLSDDLAKKAKALNPKYLVFSPKQTPDGAVPLVIYLH